MKPNVLCVGFAKCGTTTLYDIMKQHPDIYMSGIKEPIYYGNKSLVEKKGFSWYRKRYYPRKTKKKIIMEINPVIGKYVSATKIKNDFGENTKIIFMVRNPIKRLYSNFTMNLVKGDCFKNIDDNLGNESMLFDKWVVDNFLDKKGNIISNDIIPKFCKSGNYYSIINEYINVLGRNNVKVIIFEDFIKNIKKQCESIYDFIGIANDENIDYNVYSNEGNRIPYNHLSIKLTKISFNVWEKFIIKNFKYISYRFSNGLNKLIWKSTKIFSKKGKKREISYSSKIILNEYYKKMCLQLGELINVNLISKWNIQLRNIDYDDKIVLKLKKQFQEDLFMIQRKYYECSLRYNKQQFLDTMKYQKNVVMKVIKKSINYLPNSKNLQFVALNGSFAANTNVFDSDLDLNIFRKNLNVSDLVQELKLNYILARTLDFQGMDRVHSIMVYTTIKKSINYKVEDTKIIFEKNKECKCFFRENYEQSLYELVNSSRDYNVLLKYFDKKINNNEYINNWLNNFIIVKDYGEYQTFSSKLKKNMKKITETYDKEILTQELKSMEKRLNLLYNYEHKDKERIVDLKKNHKSEFIKILKNILFILQFVNINSDEKLKIRKQVESILYNQLFIITRLKIILKEFNYDLSSHSNKSMNMYEFNKLSNQLFGSKNIFVNEKKYIKQTIKILERLVIINV